jgi:hypothetical protein
LKNARSNLSISESEADVNFRFSIAPHKPELRPAAPPIRSQAMNQNGRSQSALRPTGKLSFAYEIRLARCPPSLA